MEARKQRLYLEKYCCKGTRDITGGRGWGGVGNVESRNGQLFLLGGPEV